MDPILLPTINALLNAVATCLLVVGRVLIRRKRVDAHRRVMIGAFSVSTLFLAVYVIHKASRGFESMTFNATGAMKTLYLSILFTHLTLAMVVPALAILLLARGELLGLAVGIGALLPTLIVPLNVLVNEHRLYLPVAGFVFAVTSMRGFGRIRGTGWIATLLLLGLAGLVVQRNEAWRNELSLWSDAHEKNPQAVRPLLYMGNAERARGNIDQAVRAYAKALEIEPDNAVVRAGMGNALMDLGRVDLAITAFRTALEDQPLMTDLNYSLGRALQAGGQLAEARTSYARLPVDSPHWAVALNNIGTTFEQGGQPVSYTHLTLPTNREV